VSTREFVAFIAVVAVVILLVVAGLLSLEALS